MKIDTHQHYWLYDPDRYSWISAVMECLRRDRMPEHCRQAMADAGVSYSIAVQARSEEAETEFLLGLAEATPTIAGVVGWLDLRGRDVEKRLDAWADHPLLKGFRHILQDEPNLEQVLSDPAFGRGVALLQSRGYVYDVLVRGPQLARVRDFCAAHDRHWLVLDHLGKPDLCVKDGPDARWLEAIAAMGDLPHVVCKISGLVTETDWISRDRLDAADVAAIFSCMDAVLDAFGPERMVFGSDWPVCELAAPYATVAGLTQAWAASRLSASEQSAFWAGNAQRYYNLGIPSTSPRDVTR